MTVLVTGGAGYIGSHTVRSLIQAGERVIVIDDLSTGSKQNLPDLDNCRLFFVEDNAGDKKAVTHIFNCEKIDTVLHFAGSVNVEESVCNPLKYYSNNLLSSIRLLEAMKEKGVKNLVFSSTAAVYGNPSVSPVSEEYLFDPLSPYGKSKAMFEQVLADDARLGGINYVALRYFNVAGVDPRGWIGYSLEGQPTHLIRRAVRAALGIEPKFTIFGDDYDTPDGTAVRDFVHVTDLAEAHRAALHYLRSGGESMPVNIGGIHEGRGLHGYSVQEVVDVVKEMSGTDFKVELGPRRLGDVGRVTAHTHRAEKLLHFVPSYTLRDMVQHELNWVRGSIVERIVDGVTSA